LGTGTKYVRVAAYDGKDWGNWSTYTFTIQSPNWPTTINANDTGISKRTIDDLRTKVNAVRQARGLSTVSWTDATITANVTSVRAVHLTELRNQQLALTVQKLSEDVNEIKA
jgi:hypothetical protein